MAQYIYTMNRVSKVVPPKRVILRDISLSFFPGAKIGVLGVNGSGKSSLLKIMGGIDTNFEGEARPQSGIRIGFLPQEPQLDAALDVRSTVMEGVGESFRQLEEFNHISEKFAHPMTDEEMNALLARQAQLQDAIDAAQGWELERKLEIAADALRLPPWDASIATLSGGERRRVALCRLLLSAPDMLLLDEPTNHLDAESIAWLERYLEEYPSTVIAVTHDRYFLDNVAEWILELDRGFGLPWHGNYSSWLEQKEQRLALEEREHEALRKSLAHATLFRMLTAAEQPDAGEIRVGGSVRLGYVDQSRDTLDDRKTVWQEISGGLDMIRVGAYETPSRAYVGRFNFRGAQQQQLIGELSGGERNRVHLAKVLRSGGNVLLLDEPTNDLDVETLRALEEALLSFPGCAVVISHDRWFLDRIATHVLAFEGDSQVAWFEGNYQEYVEDYRRRKGEDAVQPHRIRYKPLTR
ncbi:MAG: ATP-binding cassette domain-containing protein [Gammaproteobacteria bacterium]|nr:MAG: ATP-binding cassette domain-containing protein [Gammaproteobacteria bacterium]